MFQRHRYPSMQHPAADLTQVRFYHCADDIVRESACPTLLHQKTPLAGQIQCSQNLLLWPGRCREEHLPSRLPAHHCCDCQHLLCGLRKPGNVLTDGLMNVPRDRFSWHFWTRPGRHSAGEQFPGVAHQKEWHTSRPFKHIPDQCLPIPGRTFQHMSG